MKIMVGLVSLLAAVSTGLAQTTLENIAISKYGDTVLADIILSGKCRYAHFIPESPPERIVVDLQNTLNSWSKKNFGPLPMATIGGVRTSQYQNKPELVTRVVFDINHPTEYAVEDLPNGIRIKLPAVAEEKSFAVWQARAAATTARVGEDEVSEEPVESEVKAKVEPIVIGAAAEKEQKKPTAVSSAKTPEEKPKEKPVEKPAVSVEQKSAEDSTIGKKAAATAPKWGETPASTETKSAEKKVQVAASPPQSRETPVMGLPIEVMYERKVANYEPGLDRDPFKSLAGQGSAKAGAGRLPAVENLTLVGILVEDEGNQALFEDAEGNGYILRVNDPVKNGHLVSVQSDKAIFQITEYGWTRTVALNLKLPELR